MAREGVVFDHAYSTSPICTPSRTTIMTGMSPLVHRVLCHQNYAPPNLPQLPELLSERGYRCMVAGHYASNRGLDRGWHDQLDMIGNDVLTQALRSQYACGSKDVGWSSGAQPRGPETGHATVLTDHVVEMLDNVDPDAEPLFLHVPYIEPHPPYFPPRGYEDLIDYRELPLPPRGDDAGRPAWHRQVWSEVGTQHAGDDDIRRCLAAYYGLIAYVDTQIQRLLNELERRGILDRAWVILCSDHGDYTGEKGLFTKTETPYECLLHVPMVIRGPGGQWHAGERVSELVELTDLFPTILSAAACTVPARVQGFDLTQWLDSDERASLRQATFSAVGEYQGNLGTTMPSGIARSGRHRGLVRGARTHNFSYIRDPDYGDEAYDLCADPHELRNLLRPGVTPPEEVQQLRQAMDAWEADCDRLRRELGVIEGDRNFDEQPTPALVGDVG